MQMLNAIYKLEDDYWVLENNESNKYCCNNVLFLLPKFIIK